MFMKKFRVNSRNKVDGNEEFNITNDFFQQENWYYSRRNINFHIENNKMLIASNRNKVSYLSLFENNTNFNKPPKYHKKIELKNDSLVRITGNKSKNIKVTLYLIEYGENKKLKVNRLFLNQEQVLSIHPNTDFMRIAIRLQGAGEVTITNFKVFEDYISNAAVDVSNVYQKEIKDMKIACIFDEFSMESFGDNVTLLPVTPDNWKQILSHNRPDLLMVESAWRGNFGSWEYEIGKYNNNEDNLKLKKLVYWCKKKRIPTVFWNKEDPIHFEKFINAASLFDYIFTTDMNMINKYKEIAGHNKVFPMQFAANPKEHNPILINKTKKNKISFAGSYYANRHEERRKDMDEMLEVSKSFGLDIYDRNYERNKREKTHFMFPDKFQENIVGTLKYNQINKAYKNYKFILNINSVKESPTMFSRRVFEGLACGTPIISSYSTGIKKTFKDIVPILEDKEELKGKINELMNDSKKYRELCMKGIREVFRYHTYEHRLEYILDKLNLQYKKNMKDVTLIFSAKTLDEFQQALKLIEEQSYKEVKGLILIPLLDGYEKLLNEYNNDKISTYLIDYAYKYDSITDLVSTKYVTVMDLKNVYGHYYLEDLIHAGTYSNADIIGKASLGETEDEYAEFEYEFVNKVIEGTAIYKTKSLKKFSISELIEKESEINYTLNKEYGARIFSSDRYNLIKKN